MNDRLDNLVNSENIPEEKAKRYRRIIGTLSPESLQTKPLNNHLNILCAKVQERIPNPHNYLERVFPVIPGVIEQCPNSASGQMLQQLFVGLRGNANMLGWLHGCMAGHWPEADKSRGPYNPQTLFDEATQEALTHSNNDSMEGVLRSLTSMSSAEIVGPNAKTKLVEMACKLWPYHASAALDTIQQTDTTPRDHDVAAMLDGVAPNNTEQIEQLSVVLAHIADRMNDEECVNTAVAILSRSMRGNDEQPDLCFHLWVEAVKSKQPELLRQLIANGELNDDQHKRVWLQASRRSETLGQAFFEAVLLIEFKSEYPETKRTIIETQDNINQLFTTRDHRYLLGKVLLESFLSVASIEIQNQLVEWLKSLNADDVLKELPHFRDVTEEELEVLKNAFPKSRHLKKIHADS